MVHNAVRDKLAQCMAQAGMNVAKEVPGILPNDSQARPADILWINDSTDVHTCYDLTVTCFTKDDGIRFAENKKNSRYLSAVQGVQMDFVPLAMNTLGHFSDSFLRLITIIARNYAERSDDSVSTHYFNIMQTLQFTLIRAIARSAVRLRDNSE